MKILHVIQRYWPYTGGSERHLQEISERLVRAGHAVTVFTTDAYDLELFWNPRKQRLPIRQESHNGVEIHRFPVRHLVGGRLAFGAIRRGMAGLASLPVPGRAALRWSSRFVPWVPELTRALRQFDDDCAIIHGMNICFESLLVPALAEAKRREIPFLVTPLIHLGESERSIVRHFYTMPHQIELIAQADAVLAQTKIEIDYLVSRGISPRRLIQAGVGVNPSEILGGCARRFREVSGLARPPVVYLGTSAYDKGTVHLVQAMQRLWDAAEAPDLVPELVLAGPMLDPFERFLATLPARHRARIRVLGFIGEVEKRDLLADAAMIAMPSRTDSFGIVYLEGWLYHKPVIGARAGGVPAVIQDGVDGFLVEFGDVSTLAARIGTVLADPSLARRLGDHGYRKVNDRYTWDRIFPIVEEVYEQLCPQMTRSEGK